ncbi:hypothetical protein QKW60_10605 [Defluviimonas aestuarii]|uniref:hypothetical protein n=1 Tax=Albidovulum aestuarii TaxID=1130726 RepID=UPI00249C45A5|nr:hypothetical protein [Defluviimonas aestuarii]MDI3336861.1 hypothetical protein [Defluviimonas aestuarii]
MRYRNDIVPVEPTKGSNRQKYDGSMGCRIIEFAETGMFPEEWVCELGITMRTLYAWARSYPEFADQVEEAWHVLHAYWARLVRQNIQNPAFRQTLALRIMAKRFPSTWGRDPNNTVEHFLGHVRADEAFPPIDKVSDTGATLTIEQIRQMPTEELEGRIAVLRARRHALLKGKVGGLTN